MRFVTDQNSFPENDNPIEFLYLDRNRIASLVGQMSDKGMLTSLKSTFSKTVNNEGGASAGLPGAAQVGGKRSKSSAESSEEIYDPFWSHAYSFLRQLEEQYAVPLGRGRIGSLVTFNAFLQFLDIRVMRTLWEPIIRGMFAARSDGSALPSQEAAQLEIGIGLLKRVTAPTTYDLFSPIGA